MLSSHPMLKAALILLPLIIWVGAPPLHLAHEHDHEVDGDHRFCTLFHDLSQAPTEYAPKLGPGYVLLERILPALEIKGGEAIACALFIRGPPDSA